MNAAKEAESATPATVSGSDVEVEHSPSFNIPEAKNEVVGEESKQNARRGPENGESEPEDDSSFKDFLVRGSH